MTQTSYQTAAWLSLRHAAENLESAAFLLAPSRSASLRRLRQQVSAMREQVIGLATRLESERPGAGVYRPEGYGAAGDGVTDATAAIQAAVDAASADAGAAGGGADGEH